MHYIRASVVEKLVLTVLKEVSSFTKAIRDEFVLRVMETSSLQQEETEKAYRKRLFDCQKRSDELGSLIRKIYEDNVSGKIYDKRFEKLSADYEREQVDLEQFIANLQAELESFEEKRTRADRFLELEFLRGDSK